MTIKSYPVAYSSVNEQLIWVVYDPHSIDPTNYPNYKYVAECYVNNNLVATSAKFQDPTNNYGVFDFSAEIREYINASLLNIGNNIVSKIMEIDDFHAIVQIKFKEEYNGTRGGVIATDSYRYFYNHYNGRTSELTILASLGNKPLSDRQINIEVFQNNNYFFLPYFSESTGNFNVVINGTTTKTINNLTAHSLTQLNISPVAINNEYTNLINSDYTIAVGGKTYNCKVICEPVHTNYPVHFLNKYGGFETFNFYKAHRQTFEIERKNYKQLPYRIDSGSGSMYIKTGNIMNEQITMFGVKFKEKIKVQSNLLNNADWIFLEQLIDSPLIYLQDGATLYPAVISQSNYEVKQIEIDNWNTLELEFELGSTFKTQFR